MLITLIVDSALPGFHLTGEITLGNLVTVLTICSVIIAAYYNQKSNSAMNGRLLFETNERITQIKSSVDEIVRHNIVFKVNTMWRDREAGLRIIALRDQDDLDKGL